MDHCSTVALRHDLDFFSVSSIKSCQIPHTFWICFPVTFILSLVTYKHPPCFFLQCAGNIGESPRIMWVLGTQTLFFMLAWWAFYPQSHLPIFMHLRIHERDNGQSCCGTLCRPMPCLGWIWGSGKSVEVSTGAHSRQREPGEVNLPFYKSFLDCCSTGFGQLP